MKELDLKYTKGKLANGLQYILYKDKSLPLVSVNLWYRVGSANEVKGKTGLAHLFEHMMFQGSLNVEKELHFRYIQEAGGTLNGSTSYDRTNYYEKLPSNSLDLALWLESDRMGFLLPALTQEKLNNQKEVVRNERLERYDNQPYGLAWEILISNLYPEGHPYSWSTIGSIKDIESYSLEDVSDFFKKFYSPNNASLVICGDFELDKAINKIENYFGNLTSSNGLNKITKSNPELDKNIFIEHKDNVQLERLYLAWHSTKAYDEDDASLDVLADILSGSKNSRLNKRLVFDDQIAQDATAIQFSGKYGGHFLIISTARPKTELTKIKQIIFEELKSISQNGVTEKELEKSKNGIKASFIYSMQNLDSIADHFNHYDYYLNNPNSFQFDLERYQKVTNEMIISVAKKYLDKNYLELQIVPGAKNNGN